MHDSGEDGEDGVDPRAPSPEKPEDEDVETIRSVERNDALRQRAAQWFLLKGNRSVIAGLLVLGTFGFLRLLVALDVLVVGPSGEIATLFASGLASGLLTLVTVALSINQLILSRMFASPNELTDRMEGTRDLRHRMESIAGRWSMPNDPASFLRIVAGTLNERAEALRASAAAADADVPESLDRYAADVAAYGDALESQITDQTNIVDLLSIILGVGYAQNLAATHHFSRRYADRLPEEARAEFEAVEQLLRTIATIRQFFKTLSLQQDLAKLSRIIALTGFFGFVAVISLTLVYRSQSVTVPAALLPWIATAGLATIGAPLAALVSYVLRTATVARWTVSVGPFVPPRERSEN